jgi:hypothetical protein
MKWAADENQRIFQPLLEQGINPGTVYETRDGKEMIPSVLTTPTVTQSKILLRTRKWNENSTHNP